MIKTTLSRIRNIILYGSYVPTDFYVFDEKKLIYLSIPKVACTSIKIATMSGDTDYSEDNYMDIHSLAEGLHCSSLSGRQNSYYKFAFVRNPFDRLISCYEDKVKNPLQHNGRYFFDTGYNNKLIKRLFHKSFDSNMTFYEFVDLVSKIPDWLSDGHFRSQYSMLYKNGKKRVDYIGKFERLLDDWRPIATRFDFPELSIRNRASRQDYLTYYDSKKVLDLVRDRYKNDITTFNYEKQYLDIKSLL